MDAQTDGEIQKIKEYNGDGFLTHAVAARMPSLASKQFQEFYVKCLKEMKMAPEELKALVATDTRYRAKTVLFGVNRALSIPGDLVEFGVYHGHLAFIINKSFDIASFGKKHYLFDTWGENWEQHDDPFVAKGEIRYNKDIFDEVAKRFRPFPNVRLKRGLLPASATETIDSLSSISFLSIDVNSGNIEKDLLALTWDKLSPGAMVYLDDYGFLKYRRLPKIVSNFLSNKREEVFELANGTGIIIKS